MVSQWMDGWMDSESVYGWMDDHVGRQMKDGWVGE